MARGGDPEGISGGQVGYPRSRAPGWLSLVQMPSAPRPAPCGRSILRLFVVWIALLSGSHARADILVPGTKSVQHRLVFEDSQLFREHRLVAAPVRGFAGVHEVEPGVPIQFSSKYGTRLYLVPAGEELEGRLEAGKLPWPSCAVPVAQKAAVKLISPVQSVVTTCQLTSIDDGRPVVIEVSTVEFGGDGEPVSSLRFYGLLLGIAVAGLLLGYGIRRRLQNLRRRTTGAAE